MSDLETTNYKLKESKDITYSGNIDFFDSYFCESVLNKDSYDIYIKKVFLENDTKNNIEVKLFDKYLDAVSLFISNQEYHSSIMDKLRFLIESIPKNDNYSDSIFSLLRTLPFYADFEYLDFFIDETRNIIGANIQKNRQSLTIQFASKNIIEYSYAYNSENPGIFRMTGKAKLTSSLINSHFVKKVINSIR